MLDQPVFGGRQRKGDLGWRFVLVFALLGTSLSTPIASAQDTWTQKFPAVNPTPSYGSGMAYDALHQQVVLFGGETGGNDATGTNETWVWDGTAWTKLSPATSPSVRGETSMVYDAARQQIVLFGGEASSNSPLNDTWVWDGTNWTKKTPATSPPARGYHAMAYDELHHQVVIYGGLGSGVLLNDTWVWDGANWAQKSPATSPPVRQYPLMVYDSARQNTVMFGGLNAATGLRSDTWLWNGTTWAQAAPATSPSPRALPEMAYDPLRQTVVLFSGIGNPSLADTWEWDGSNWIQLSPPASPSIRGEGEFVFDIARQQLVMFGGAGSGLLHETWVFGNAQPGVTINVPTGVLFSFNGTLYIGTQTISVAPGTYTLSVNSPQAVGVGTQLAFQSWSDGGAQSHSITVGASPLTITGNFTTQYLMTASANPGNGGTVTQTSATSSGPYYDAGTLVSVFEQPAAGFNFTGWSGACSGTGACFVTMNAPATVTANFARPTYLVTINVPVGVQYTVSGLPITGPGSIMLPAGNWDLVLASPQSPGAGVHTVFLSWSDGGAASHTITVVSSPVTITGTFKTQYLLTTTATPAIGGVAGASAPGPSDPYYDAGSVLILQATPNASYDFLYWGGACSGSNSLCLVVMSGPKTATANFDSSLKWIPLFPATSPSPRIGPAMVYDEARQQVVLFGGNALVAHDPYNDTWVWDGVNWTQKNPAHSPPASGFLGIAYDAFHQQTVLFGGFSAAGSNLPPQTWVWDGTDWTQKFPAASPPNRNAGGMVYDGARQRVVLFGGQYVAHFADTPVFLSDTWTWDGTNWTQMLPAISPPGRTYQGMTYDGARQEVVLFGGIADGHNGVFLETWTWNGTTWSQKAPVSIPTVDSSSPLAYDALTQQVILPAAYPALSTQPDVTWFWDGTNWAQKLLPVTPQPLTDSATVYDAARQQLVLFGGFGSTQNITWIYANHVNPPQYTLTTTVTPAGSGTVVPVTSGQPGPSYYTGTPVSLTATPSAGYAFQSWSGACSGSGLCVVTMDADKSVTANFTNGPINVTINVPPSVQFAFNGTTYTGPQTIALPPGSYPLSMASPQAASAGSQLAFISWSDGGNLANRNVVVGGLPLTISATFKTQYLLTTAVSPGGQGTISPASGYFDPGSVQTVTLTPNPGYVFVSWSGACSGAGACSVTMNSPQTVTANLAQGTFPVQITVPAGLVFSLNGVPYTTSANVALAPGSYTLSTTATQSTGAGVQAAFVSWSDGGALSHQINVAAPVSITGTFKTQYQLAASAVPSNEGTVTQTGAVGSGPFYDPGTVVLVTATAQPGYQFQSWSGACSGVSAGCFVTMSGPQTVNANFGAAQTWVQLFPAASPSARVEPAMAWDNARQQALLFGGITFTGEADTWTFDGFNWTLLNPPNAPAVRAGHAMAFDSAASRVVLFSGGLQTEVADTWLWDGSNWTLKTPVTKPPERTFHGMAYDAARGQTVIFGGLCSNLPGACFGPLGDTWVWDGANWTQRFPAHSPSVRLSPSMIYDSANQVVVLFGGLNGVGNYVGDTWVWNGVDWAQQHPINSPPGRRGGAMTYDPIRQQSILFGGRDQSNVRNDTWVWDGVNWLQRFPSQSPSARESSAIAFDAVHQQPVLFGGNDFSNTPDADTWVWLTPNINVVPQTPALANDGKGNYQVQITIKNQGNVPLTSISLTAIKLGGVSAASYIGATTRPNVLPGGTTSFIAVFPIASVPGKTASLSFNGVYSAASIVNAAWSGSVRSVALP